MRTPALLALMVLLAGCGGGGSSGGSMASTVAAATSGSPAPTTSTTTAPAATSSTTTTTTLPSGTLRVLSYNVAGLPQLISQVTPSTNTPLISPKLNTYDLVLVQEDFWYHAQLAQAATHAYQTPPLTGYSTPVNDGLNLFSRVPYYGLMRVKWSSWYGLFSSNNDGLSSKGFSFSIHTLGPGVDVHVYDLHADAGGDQGDIDARRENFDQLADFIEAFSAGQPLLVAGDTNLSDRRSQDAVVITDFITRLGLTDAARALQKPEIIDRVMLRSNADVELTPTLWRLADEFVDAAGQPLSDHDAVNIDIAWRRLR
jgi:hypothetical protein